MIGGEVLVMRGIQANRHESQEGSRPKAGLTYHGLGIRRAFTNGVPRYAGVVS